MLVLLLLGAAFVHVTGADAKEALNQRHNPPRQTFMHSVPEIALTNNLPIVAAHPNAFMTLTYYGSPALVGKLYYVSSEELSRRLQGFTFLERMMIGSAPFFGTRVVEYREFVRTHPTFYVEGGLGGQEWIIAQLIRDKAYVQLLQGGPIDQRGDQAEPFFLIHMAPASDLPR